MPLCFVRDYSFWPLSKTDLRDLFFSHVLNLEEIAFFEIKHSGDDVRREHLNLVVDEQYLVVVVLPGKSDFVFGTGKLFLNREYWLFSQDSSRRRA